MIDGKDLVIKRSFLQFLNKILDQMTTEFLLLNMIKRSFPTLKKLIQAAKSDCLRWWFRFNVRESHEVSRTSLKEEMKAQGIKQRVTGEILTVFPKLSDIL